MYDLKDENQAKEYLENLDIEYRYQCYKENIPEGCHRLADFFESVRKQFVKAATVYQTNCQDHGYGHSCFKYGNYRLIGRGCEKSAEVAMDYYLKGCDAGYPPACHNAALLLHQNNTDSGQDSQRAVTLMTKACQEKYAASCYQLSGWFITGSGVIPKDMRKAFEFSKQACDLGECYACANLSQMYRKGEGVNKDEKLAEEYKVKAVEILKEMKESHRTLTLNQ